MSYTTRRSAVSALLALGAYVPFVAGAREPTLVARLLGRSRSREAYEWLPTECADRRYPMQLVHGTFECGDKRFIDVPAGKIVNNGWGEIGSRRLVGEPSKPVPLSLDLAWFSFAEDRFFGGSVELPAARIAELFEAGFAEPTTGARVTWTKIVVGMGPGGWTSVWMAGSGLVHEVVRARLDAREIDWRHVLDNPDIERSDYIHSKLESRLGEDGVAHLAEHGVDLPGWERHARAHPWQLVAGGLHQPLSAFVRAYNGERSFHELGGPSAADLQAVPRELQVTWSKADGGRLLSEIQLDEDEVFGAFDGASAGAATLLRVEYAPRNQIALSVEHGAVRVPLVRARATVSTLR